MKIIAKYHLTATEKSHIKQIIANGWLKGSTKKKSYELEETDEGFSGKVYTTERNDYGKQVERFQSFVVILDKEVA